ncbi:MAG: hypothetical protein IPN09_13505 [Bacteroidetes bacterium]|nr:hypothetical protein [Bacteroidota bacterium]
MKLTAFCNSNGTPRFSAFLFPKMILDITSGHISISMDLQVSNSRWYQPVISTNGMIDAFNYIRLGKSRCICGGWLKLPLQKLVWAI